LIHVLLACYLLMLGNLELKSDKNNEIFLVYFSSSWSQKPFQGITAKVKMYIAKLCIEWDVICTCYSEAENLHRDLNHESIHDDDIKQVAGCLSVNIQTRGWMMPKMTFNSQLYKTSSKPEIAWHCWHSPGIKYYWNLPLALDTLQCYR